MKIIKFIIKLFPEITIKSKSVRLRFIKILANNIFNILKVLDKEIIVIRGWDKIEINTKKIYCNKISDALTRVPGIHYILLIKEYEFRDLDHIFELIYTTYAKLLINKTFCVRVKRKGNHNFSSIDIERYVGGRLNQNILSAKVKLNQPDIIIKLEIENNKVIIIQSTINGIGGFPIGTQEDVLSLISGGFDSGVSSYMLIRRGCRVHYCFFNLGGIKHKIGVKQIASHLWNRFSSSHKVYFVMIDFTLVMNEIILKINDSYMGIILKRMMIRAASMIAERHKIQALVTGESLGQVSSQTLTNLRLINDIASTLILRPLISCDKEDIINIARKIGVATFVHAIPEYCSIISKKPTVKAIKEKIEEQESNFDLTILDYVINTARNIDIRQIMNDNEDEVPTIQIVNEFSVNDIILDIRSPDEQESRPLKLVGVNVVLFPFYKINSQFNELSPQNNYLLYCEHGTMSHLQALYLYKRGFKNIKIYQPF